MAAYSSSTFMGEVSVESDIGHADDAMHGGTQLMAHSSQECTLGPTAGLGLFFCTPTLGNFGLEFLRPCLDVCCQCVLRLVYGHQGMSQGINGVAKADELLGARDREWRGEVSCHQRDEALIDLVQGPERQPEHQQDDAHGQQH